MSGRRLALAGFLLASCWAAVASAQGGSRSLRAVGGTSPPPPLRFPPLCDCDRRLRNSPYRLVDGDTGVTPAPPASANFNYFCFVVDVLGTCNTASKCCQGQDLYKVCAATRTRVCMCVGWVGGGRSRLRGVCAPPEGTGQGEGHKLGCIAS